MVCAPVLEDNPRTKDRGLIITRMDAKLYNNLPMCIASSQFDVKHWNINEKYNNVYVFIITTVITFIEIRLSDWSRTVI